MFQYILFDLDGTLTDPKEGITKSVQYALQKQGIMESDLDKLEPFIGPPLKKSLMEFYQMSEEDAETAVVDYRERFQATGIFENIIYPGIPEMLAALKKRGSRLAVASSKPEVFVERILRYFHIAEYFDEVVGSGLDGTLSEKEEVVEEALRRLGKGKPPDPARCAMVGDRKFDIYGGRLYGLTTVGVSYGYAGKGELKEAGADHIVKTVKELTELLCVDTEGGKHGAVPDGRDASVHAGAGYVIGGGSHTQGAFGKTWDILFPFILYYIGFNFCYMLIAALIQYLSQTSMQAGEWLHGNSIFAVSATRVLSMLTGCAFVLPMFKRETSTWKREPLKNYLFSGIIAVSAAVGMNILFNLIGITGMSAEFTQVARDQYWIPVWQGVILFGIISPLVEETVFRGIIYNRMKRIFSWKVAVVGSAVVFGGYHGNPVQGLYGFALGLLIAYLYETSGDFKVPVFFHSAANLSVFLLTYRAEAMEQIGTWFNCMLFLIIMITGLYVYRKPKRN